ncbi:hypothetical protein HK100_002322 [Physocladia obscura]|uniref:C2H2-type domain-containing protein n=1 Tax=Physocladia obscura TaxID=109957 RepID=A0AAD5SYP3_9FUNG|nr:hypothetical protein HK100_002322 [Physocladia obscura]
MGLSCNKNNSCSKYDTNINSSRIKLPSYQSINYHVNTKLLPSLDESFQLPKIQNQSHVATAAVPPKLSKKNTRLPKLANIQHSLAHNRPSSSLRPRYSAQKSQTTAATNNSSKKYAAVAVRSSSLSPLPSSKQIAELISIHHEIYQKHILTVQQQHQRARQSRRRQQQQRLILDPIVTTTTMNTRVSVGIRVSRNGCVGDGCNNEDALVGVSGVGSGKDGIKIKKESHPKTTAITTTFDTVISAISHNAEVTEDDPTSFASYLKWQKSSIAAATTAAATNAAITNIAVTTITTASADELLTSHTKQSTIANNFLPNNENDDVNVTASGTSASQSSSEPTIPESKIIQRGDTPVAEVEEHFPRCDVAQFRWRWGIRRVLAFVRARSIFTRKPVAPVPPPLPVAAGDGKAKVIDGSRFGSVFGSTGEAIGFNVCDYRAKKTRDASEAKLRGAVPSVLLMLGAHMRTALMKDMRFRTVKDLAELEKLANDLPVLAKYDGGVRRALSKVMGFSHFGPRRTIIREGHSGQNFYIIMSGSAQVITFDHNETQILTNLSAGESFGELALLNNMARKATIVSKTDIDLLSINREQFMAVLQEEAIRDMREKQQVIESIPYFAQLSPSAIQQLTSTAKFREVPANTEIFIEGDFPSSGLAEINYYSSSSIHGNKHSLAPFPFDASPTTTTAKTKIRAKYGYKTTDRLLRIGISGPGDFFGEDAAIASVGTPHQIVHLGNFCNVDRIARCQFTLVSNTRVKYAVLNNRTFTKEIVMHPQLLNQAGERAKALEAGLVNVGEIQDMYLKHMRWIKYKKQVVEEACSGKKGAFARIHLAGLPLRLLQETRRQCGIGGSGTTKAALAERIADHLALLDGHGGSGSSNVDAASRSGGAVVGVDVGVTHLASARIAANQTQPSDTTTTTQLPLLTAWSLHAVDDMALSYSPVRLASRLNSFLCSTINPSNNPSKISNSLSEQKHGKRVLDSSKKLLLQQDLNLLPPADFLAIEHQQFRPFAAHAMPIVRCAAVEAMLVGIASALNIFTYSVSAKAVADWHGIVDSGRAKKLATVEKVLAIIAKGDRVIVPEHLKSVFLGSKKKDDLADALLIAVAAFEWRNNSLKELSRLKQLPANVAELDSTMVMTLPVITKNNLISENQKKKGEKGEKDHICKLPSCGMKFTSFRKYLQHMKSHEGFVFAENYKEPPKKRRTTTNDSLRTSIKIGLLEFEKSSDNSYSDDCTHDFLDNISDDSTSHNAKSKTVKSKSKILNTKLDDCHSESTNHSKITDENVIFSVLLPQQQLRNKSKELASPGEINDNSAEKITAQTTHENSNNDVLNQIITIGAAENPNQKKKGKKDDSNASNTVTKPDRKKIVISKPENVNSKTDFTVLNQKIILDTKAHRQISKKSDVAAKIVGQPKNAKSNEINLLAFQKNSKSGNKTEECKK